MAWFRKERKPKAVRRGRTASPIPEGLWTKCEGCKEAIFSRELEKNLQVCPKCGYHFRIDSIARVHLLLDEEEPRELLAGLRPSDPLGFVDTKRYRDRLRVYQQEVGVKDAVVVVEGHLEGEEVLLAVMEYRFMGGSMGSVVGEKISRAAELATARRVPLIVVAASGGARMQEGILSLMQMAKIAAALARLRAAGLPYLSVLTDPTTGGVTASFAMLGDLNIAEPGALIGFAGPRVIQQTIRQDLPEGFQRSEFLVEHGFLDLVVPRHELKATLARCLRHLHAA
ncbi:MAG TPA: acetyl-CoA carboxylase, carboxyltransferase subunit beta [Thermoanaerobaculia bacterium]|jgi:acetyl-CoA carboxylase carboxyl transferase subunit beta|nr:acetyl-CoA carboxylase, carboxyltransferase subunit beta [Thermoanaerobaculia bacterium]